MMSESQENQKYIYVLLSRTHTVPARLIRLFTREPYSHTSIALDIELKDMYSFARKNVHNPFDCGFINEDIESGVFGMDRNIYCSVYAVPVTDEQYQNIKKEINVFIKNREEYRYNYTGLVSIMFGRNVEDGKHFFCSQFVSHIFYKSGIRLFAKEEGLIKPYDFHVRLKDKRIYKGRLCEYRNFLKCHPSRMITFLQEEYPQAI